LKKGFEAHLKKKEVSFTYTKGGDVMELKELILEELEEKIAPASVSVGG